MTTSSAGSFEMTLKIEPTRGSYFKITLNDVTICECMTRPQPLEWSAEKSFRRLGHGMHADATGFFERAQVEDAFVRHQAVGARVQHWVMLFEFLLGAFGTDIAVVLLVHAVEADQQEVVALPRRRFSAHGLFLFFYLTWPYK